MVWFATNSTEPRWHKWVYIGVLFSAQILLGLCVQHKDFALVKLGIRVQAALATSIVKKVYLFHKFVLVFKAIF